jgi:hypothetical protein
MPGKPFSQRKRLSIAVGVVSIMSNGGSPSHRPCEHPAIGGLRHSATCNTASHLRIDFQCNASSAAVARSKTACTRAWVSFLISAVVSGVSAASLLFWNGVLLVNLTLALSVIALLYFGARAFVAVGVSRRLAHEGHRVITVSPMGVKVVFNGERNRDITRCSFRLRMGPCHLDRDFGGVETAGDGLLLEVIQGGASSEFYLVARSPGHLAHQDVQALMQVHLCFQHRMPLGLVGIVAAFVGGIMSTFLSLVVPTLFGFDHDGLFAVIVRPGDYSFGMIVVVTALMGCANSVGVLGVGMRSDWFSFRASRPATVIAALVALCTSTWFFGGVIGGAGGALTGAVSGVILSSAVVFFSRSFCGCCGTRMQ